jgi:WD40 repeat protein
MLTIRQEHPPLIDIDVGSEIRAGTFTANGEYIVGGGGGLGLGVWRATDGKQMSTMAARLVWCLAASKDGKWIAAGTYEGDVFVWDAETHQQVFAHKDEPFVIYGVDFSLDSTRLVTGSRTTAVWDIKVRKKVLTLDHDDWAIAVKYSPQGDRIATATSCFVRVWDNTDGHLIVHIPVTYVIPLFNTGLLWSDNHLFVVSTNKITELDSKASTGSALSEWLVPETNNDSCIALPKHGEFIAYSTNDTVTFWDTSTQAQLGFIQHTEAIRSIALSPDDRFLAIGGNSGKIALKDLRDVLPASCPTVSIVYCLVLLPILLTSILAFGHGH